MASLVPSLNQSTEIKPLEFFPYRKDIVMHYSTMFEDFIKTPEPSNRDIAKVVKKLIKAVDEDRTHMMGLRDHIVEVKSDLSEIKHDLKDLKGTVEMGFGDVSEKLDNLSSQMGLQTDLLQQIAINTKK